MLVEFDNISDTSRTWIYSSPISLNNENQDFISKLLSNHLDSWQAHQVSLKAAYTILENHFIVIALDENIAGASGCSIDNLQHKIQEIENYLAVSLTNRLNIFCIIDDKIKCIPSSELSKFANKETLFYDLTIQKKSDLNSYLKPIKEGWCSRLVK
jgi:hypothetical protein|tara:strand:- start:26253 stop:26720 length:468 start_codon:yes stop_codon:yes gene_type:complete